MSQRVCFMEIEMIKGGNVYTFIRLKEEPMTEFEKLVSEQMKTMDKLLDLQSELDRCKQIEAELRHLERDAKLRGIQAEIAVKRKHLADIQDMFQKQTEQVIRSYRRLRKAVFLCVVQECAIPRPEWLFYFHFSICNVIIGKRRCR